MKLLVTGADGMLGSSLCPELRGRGHEVIATNRQPSEPGTVALDISDGAAVDRMIREARPDVVVHLAAETDVDYCEQDPAHAYRINAAATELIVRACRAAGSRLLYMSTGSVFDGKKPTPYVETDPPNPVNVYARSKLAGEVAARQLEGRFQIVRAGWMVGGFERDKKFVGKILRLLEERRELSVVTDKRGSLTFTSDLAQCMARLAETEHTGIFHMTNQGVCSRYEVACAIVDYVGRTDVTIHPVTSDAFPLPAPRSDSEALQNVRLQALGLDIMPPWQDTLRAYVQRYLAMVKHP